MEKIISKDSITIVRKDGENIELAQIPIRKIIRGSQLSDEQARAITITKLEKDPNVVLIIQGDDDQCIARASLSDNVELTMKLSTGERPEGRVEMTSAKDGNSSAGAFFTIVGKNGEQDDVIEHTLDCVMGLLEQYEQSTKQECQCPTSQGLFMFISEAKEIMEQNGMQPEGFLSADIDFEPFTFIHDDEVLLMGSEHFKGYDLFVEVKRLFIGASTEQKQKAVKKTEKGNDIEAIHCADESWSFRKPLNITSKETFLNDLNIAISELKQAIEQVGDEPDGDARMEVQRQLFTWEVLDAVVKYKQLPM